MLSTWKPLTLDIAPGQTFNRAFHYHVPVSILNHAINSFLLRSLRTPGCECICFKLWYSYICYNDWRLYQVQALDALNIYNFIETNEVWKWYSGEPWIIFSFEMKYFFFLSSCECIPRESAREIERAQSDGRVVLLQWKWPQHIEVFLSKKTMDDK